MLYVDIHTHPFNGPFSRTRPLPGWAGTRKAKPIWILLKQETVSSSGISWAICKSAPHSWQITTPASHNSRRHRPTTDFMCYWPYYYYYYTVDLENIWQDATLNTCCDVACLTFQLSHTTTVLFRAISDNPQLALFRVLNVWKNATNLQSVEKIMYK